MATAPKDGTSCLLKFKDDLANYDPNGIGRLDRFQGKQFVGRWPGKAGDEYDYGWNFAAPVGHGGIDDRWLVGWMRVEYENGKITRLGKIVDEPEDKGRL